MTLNPVTAYPFLILSEDRKQVKRGEKLQFYRNSPQRFDVWSCVIAKEAFSHGRHYWEVRALLVVVVPPGFTGSSRLWFLCLPLVHLMLLVALIEMVPLLHENLPTCGPQ